VRMASALVWVGIGNPDYIVTAAEFVQQQLQDLLAQRRQHSYGSQAAGSILVV